MKTTVIEKYNADGKLIEKTTITETNDAGKISWNGPGSDADWWKKISVNTGDASEPLKTFLNPNPSGKGVTEATLTVPNTSSCTIHLDKQKVMNAYG